MKILTSTLLSGNGELGYDGLREALSIGFRDVTMPSIDFVS